MLRCACAVVLALTSACTFSFESVSEVKDLRILGLSAEVPELTPVSFAPAVEVTALVAGVDPMTEVHVVWSSCLVAPTAPAQGGGPMMGPQGGAQGGSVCPADAGTVEVSRGASLAGEVAQSIPVPREILGSLALGGRGLSLQLQVQLQVNELYAVKKIAVTSALGAGQEPNRNPALQGLTFDGEAWDADRVGPFDSCAPEQRTVEEDGGVTVPGACRHEIAPVFDPGQTQTYRGPGRSGELELQRERLRFAWFSDDGALTPATTQEPDPAALFNRPTTATQWREPGAKPGTVTFWVVVRDGRGGESWVQRRLVFE